MDYWIFTVTSHRKEGLQGEEIFRQRMKDAFWGLGDRTPNRKTLTKGDNVVFYVGNPQKMFAGTARLSSDQFFLTDKQKDDLDHGRQFYRPEYGVFLDQIEIWNQPRTAESVVGQLEFIKRVEVWGTYLQGGIRQISETDFRTICLGASASKTSIVTAETANDSEFALEAHLEDFIDKNWDRINFSCRLSRYLTDDGNGRQFPAGTWSIDFLCVDDEAGDLVVIELKKGRSSDTTVGQVLRYIAWVRENIAKPNQGVRGLIIAKELDESLRYAVMEAKSVSVLTYKVDFTLTAPSNAKASKSGI